MPYDLLWLLPFKFSKLAKVARLRAEYILLVFFSFIRKYETLQFLES